MLPLQSTVKLNNGVALPRLGLIRWCLNASVFAFAFSPEDLRRLDGMNEDLYTGWDPTGVP